MALVKVKPQCRWWKEKKSSPLLVTDLNKYVKVDTLKISYDSPR